MKHEQEAKRIANIKKFASAKHLQTLKQRIIFAASFTERKLKNRYKNDKMSMFLRKEKSSFDVKEERTH